MENARGLKEKKVLPAGKFEITGNSKIIVGSIDIKIKNISLWSTVCSLLGYLVVTLSIVKTYIAFSGKHPVLLSVTLFNLCFAMGVLIYLACKTTFKDNRFTFPDEVACLHHHVQRLAGQRKLVFLYMLEYTLLLTVSGIFFSGIMHGVPLMLKLTLPVSIITYVSGAYFIISSFKLTRKLNMLQTERKRRVPLTQFSQN